MHSRLRTHLRAVLALMLAAAVAVTAAPAGHAADGVGGDCEFLAPSPVTVREGERPRARITFRNSSGASARFTATVLANAHYHEDTPFYSQLLAAETGLVQAEVELPPAYAVRLEEEPVGLRIKITSSQTDDLPIGTCSTQLKLRQGRDSDRDGLLDSWETNGIDYDGDGQIDLALNDPPYHANPNVKDIFVELDAMACAESYCLRPREFSPGVIGQVEATFAAYGIALHVRKGELIAEAPEISFDSKVDGPWNDFDDLRNGYPEYPCDGAFGDVLDRISPNCRNILGAKRLVFRYAVSAHGLSPATLPSGAVNTRSGQAELGDLDQRVVDISYLGGIALPGGNDFVVTLGKWSNQLVADNGGQAAAEAGTFMHELGHTLGLQHGGIDKINCKPNYLSVMNYTHQFPNADPTRPLDYQPQERPLLEEDQGLDEQGPAVPGAGARTIVYGLRGVQQTALANQAVNWNGDTVNGTAESGDINHIAFTGDTDSCPASPKQTLYSWNDWEHLNLDFRRSPMFADGAHHGVTGLGASEITAEAAASLNPPVDLTAAKSVNRQEAAPGDPLTYTVEVGNKGPATATAVSVEDTMPDGTVVKRTPPDLAAGGSAKEQFTYTVPCATPDGAVLTNKVTVSGTNPRGMAETGTLADNTATAATTVRRPILALEAAATPAAGAGEAVTYTLAYRNTGSGPAAAGTLTATLPADLYYSTALDQGAGPRPGAVVRNADGTTTLRWDTGQVPAGSASRTITFTARPSLLVPEGTAVTVPVTLSFTDGGGCPSARTGATAETRITVPEPSLTPRPVAIWSVFHGLRTPEALARVQATDQRFDGADGTAPDGLLAQQEASATFLVPLPQPRTLRAELLATHLNLATRRINAGTELHSPQARALGLRTVGDAVRHAQATLALPTGSDLLRYTTATVLLASINAGV